MPKKEIKIVQETGGGYSLGVTLPRAWARRNKIKKGTYVEIEEKGDKVIIKKLVT